MEGISNVSKTKSIVHLLTFGKKSYISVLYLLFTFPTLLSDLLQSSVQLLERLVDVTNEHCVSVVKLVLVVCCVTKFDLY